MIWYKTLRVALIGWCIALAIAAFMAFGVGAVTEEAGAADNAPARLVVELAPGAPPRAHGLLPEGVSPGDLTDALPGLQTGGLKTGGTGDAEHWHRVVEGLGIVLPRIRQATIEVKGTALTLSGTVVSGFSAKDTAAALRLALGPGWSREIALSEPPLPAQVTLIRDAGGVTLTGILPAGLSIGTARALTGASNGTALSTGGDGALADWLPVLRLAGLAMRAYAPGTSGVIAAGHVAFDGPFAPGFSARRVSRDLAPFVPGDWDLDLDGAAGPESDSRHDILTGWPEQRTDKRWIPMPAIARTIAACAAATRTVTGLAPIRFDAGGDQLAAATARTLDRLAGLARHCLDETGLKLEIGGHTDDRGNEPDNLALSEDRARAVARALTTRGVDPGTLSAIGFGETRPVADNATPEGRARNRRITLDWVRPVGG